MRRRQARSQALHCTQNDRKVCWQRKLSTRKLGVSLDYNLKGHDNRRKVKQWVHKYKTDSASIETSSRGSRDCECTQRASHLLRCLRQWRRPPQPSGDRRLGSSYCATQYESLSSTLQPDTQSRLHATNSSTAQLPAQQVQM